MNAVKIGVQAISTSEAMPTSTLSADEMLIIINFLLRQKDESDDGDQKEEVTGLLKSD